MRAKDPLAEARKKGNKGWLALAVFGTIFALVGAAGVTFLFVLPVLKMRQARGWTPTPCVILSSRVKEHSGSESTTYSVDIEYSYTFGEGSRARGSPSAEAEERTARVSGQSYTSSRYNFFGGSSSGHSAKAKIVRRYPPGSRAVCYVNPQKPSEAVLERGFVSDMYFGLIPLVFFVVGGALDVVAIRQAFRKRRPVPSDWRRDVAGEIPVSAAAAGPAVLKSTASRFGRLAAALFACLFWNGIVSLGLWQMIQGWRRGKPDWFLTLFLVPFEVVGLVLIGAVFYLLLAVFNPRVRLVVSSPAVPLGGAFEVAWVVFGRVERFRRLRIFLEGREEATYRRGTSTTTDKHTFAEIDLADVSDPGLMQSGNERPQVPADTMHTFKAPNNKVLWHLCVKGEIPFWPDVKDEFDLTVLPREAGGGTPP